MNRSKEIKEKLKNELGYNSRQVSVKENSCGYSWSFDLTIRDASVDFKKVEDFAKSCERIDRCEYSGEILSGSNIFVHVKVSDEVQAKWAEKYLEDVSIALAVLKHSDEQYIKLNDNVSIRKDGDYKVQVIFWNGSGQVGENGMYFSYESAKNLSVYLYKKFAA